MSRFQKNLFQDRSFLLRVQYLKDGWTLFTQSPLTGHGLGATEGLLTSVQPFFYQSLYLHNHILQVMDETGLLGLAAFLALMLGAAWLLVRRLHESPRVDGDLLLRADVPVCRVFPGPYECCLLWGSPRRRSGVRILRVVGTLAAALWLVVSFAMLLGSQMAQAQFRDFDTTDMTRSEFLDSMEKLDRMDAYTDQDYKVNRMVNALQEGGQPQSGCGVPLCPGTAGDRGFDACYAEIQRFSALRISSLRSCRRTNSEQFNACVEQMPLISVGPRPLHNWTSRRWMRLWQASWQPWNRWSRPTSICWFRWRWMRPIRLSRIV